MLFEVFGLFSELTAAHPEGQFGIRKFKAILLGLPGLVQCFLQVTDVGGGFERVLSRFGAPLLELLQIRFGQQEGAVEALLVETEAGEQIAAAVEGFGLDEGAVDGGIVRG